MYEGNKTELSPTLNTVKETDTLKEGSSEKNFKNFRTGIRLRPYEPNHLRPPILMSVNESVIYLNPNMDIMREIQE